MTISLCMIVKDEEAMLPRCLESVKHLADEMVIVDTGSADRTAEIARSHGAHVYEYAWDDSFANARNFALGKASMDWILLMDADDEFESQDTQKLRDLMAKGDEADVYYFRTLSYMGNTPDRNNTISNMNVRLVRNRRGYRFKGEIHEQLVNDSEPVSRIGVADIRVFHYGYLNSVVTSKNKRERNIALVRKELDKEPDNAFMLCNMGNECYSSQRFEEALGWYLKSWEHFDSRRGFSSKLLLRIISCYDLLGQKEEQHRFIKKGLEIYPDFTDLEFIRANDYLQRKKYLAAIRSFKRCLKMGEPPLVYSYATGVGSFKAQYMLLGIYDELGDREEAIRWCRAAIKSNPAYTEAYLQLGRMLLESKIPMKTVRVKLERLAQPGLHPQNYALLSDVFYTLRQYGAALDYIRKAKAQGFGSGDMLPYDEGACLLHLRRFSEAAAALEKAASGEYADKALFLRRLCALLDRSVPMPPRGKGVWFEVMDAFENITQGLTCKPLASDYKSSQAYVTPIFSLMDLLMRLGEFDLFDRSRQLLNLVTDESVLMRLGKLYFRHGFASLAYSELVRSLTLTGHIDADGLDMMKQCLGPQPL